MLPFAPIPPEVTIAPTDEFGEAVVELNVITLLNV
jgi:hypothetical protein